ncbi:uncharacterized protein LOC117537732 [Gymnodraco acuticeps]|uniref:Uncharacterized protein LOC117537732 n=1 Tax=Gymnodraco acuticeps TaxID=8218 RepID=A0A6P8T5L4_GYMAC|nr:uncharacterized protein LOC117537732 [Gymnodraco acuticeps]XP_034058949.1 uncharacterized protein LOC117537732 [Gymnodraco acuticeps]
MEVVTAHCNCMAGLSESCSHVGAVLFAIEAGVKMRETASCTTEKCKWLMPSHVKKIPAAPVAMIDFSSAKSKKQKLDDAIAGRTGEKHTFQRPTVQGSKLERGSERYMQFFKTLSRNSPRGGEANLRLCAGEQGFCLVNDGGTVKLDRRHAYYHQIQAQLHLVDVDYCDFVVWTKNDLFVERIVRDVDLWDNIIPRVERFFRLCVLPEVLGQQLTRGKFQLQDDQEGEKA